LLNRSEKPKAIKVSWDELDISGSWNVHDLWQHKNLRQEEEKFESEVPAHACKVIKISK